MRFILSLIIMLGLIFNLSAQVFDYVVAKDGSGDYSTIQAAIDATPNDVRTIIFVKSGLYEEKVMIGSHTQSSKKILSIIGEDPEKVIITWDDYNGKVVNGKTIGGTDCGTFIVNAVDFYAENLTIQNTYTQAQAIALYNVGDRQVFKNCRIIGYQDTHRLRKGRRYYFKDSYIEGAVDYIYCAGPAIYDDCELRTIRNGGYVVAPEDVDYSVSANGKNYMYCFVFRNCTLTSPDNIEYYLGRPWKVKSSAVFIDSKMQGVKKEGWAIWSGNTNHTSAFFAEHNSMDLDGNPLDISNRVDWSYQLTKEEIETYYTPEKIYSFVSGVNFDPFTIVIAPDKPLNLRATTDALSWDAVADAKGYIIYENGSIIGFSTTPSFLYTSNLVDNSYYIKTVAANGNLSVESQSIGNATGIGDNHTEENSIYVKDGMLYLPENQRCEIYSLSGIKVKSTELVREINLQEFSKETYIVRVKTLSGILSEKIAIK